MMVKHQDPSLAVGRKRQLRPDRRRIDKRRRPSGQIPLRVLWSHENSYASIRFLPLRSSFDSKILEVTIHLSLKISDRWISPSRLREKNQWYFIMFVEVRSDRVNS